MVVKCSNIAKQSIKIALKPLGCSRGSPSLPQGRPNEFCKPHVVLQNSFGGPLGSLLGLKCHLFGLVFQNSSGIFPATCGLAELIWGIPGGQFLNMFGPKKFYFDIKKASKITLRFRMCF